MQSTPGAVTLITAFEVPPEADTAFVEGWERARDAHAGKDRSGRTVLHRALRTDAELRFVDVARVASPEAWRQAVAGPALTGGEIPCPAHPGVYGVVHEDGIPDGRDGVVLINAFEVADGEEDRFMTGWDRARELLAAQPGYLGTRLHRSLGPADFRFVEIARWSSPLAFTRARSQPGLQPAAAMPFASHAALYQVRRA